MCRKLEIRISKPETNQKSKPRMFQANHADLNRQAFLFSPIGTLGCVSDFEIRVSDLFIVSPRTT